jgi:hypothetical protein
VHPAVRLRRMAARAASPIVDALFVAIDRAFPVEETWRGRGLRRVIFWVMFRRGRASRLLPSSLGRLASQLHLYLHDRERARRSDPALVALSTPPVQERLSIPRIWVVELVTSATAEDVLRALRNSRLELRHKDVDEWLLDVRGRAPFLGSRGLGTFQREKSGAAVIGRSAIAQDLPNRFSQVELRVRSITRTINAVIAEFTLTDEAAGQVEALLRRPTLDEVVRSRRGGVGLRPAEQIKRDNVEKWREEVSSDAHKWLSNHVPGVFSHKRTWRAVPTAELAIIDHEMPLQGIALSQAAQWLRACGLAGKPGGVWIGTDPVGLRAQIPAGFEGAISRNHLILAAPLSHLLASSPLGGLPSRSALPDAFRYREWDGLLAAWAIRSLLEVWEAQGALSRDFSSRRWRRWRTARALDEVRDYLRTIGIDVAISADELQNLVAEDSSTFDWDFPGFVWPGSRKGPSTLVESLRAEIEERSRRIERLIQRLTETLESIGSITAAAAGVRLQRTALFVGVVAVAVAVIGVIIALHGHS